MKRFLLVLLLCLIPYLSFASGPQVLVQGTATGTTQIRLSTVDGTAFIDGDGTVPCTSFIGEKLEIVDSAGKKISGFVKAAGDGEDLSVTEKFTDPIYENDAAWTIGSGWTVNAAASGKAEATTSTANLTEAISLTAGGLYKLVTNCDALTGGTYQAIIEATNIGTAVNTTAAVSWYRTVAAATAATNGTKATTSLSATFTGISLKQATGPSATGCTIVSTKDGATYNWNIKESGFDPNSASFTYRILSTNIPGSTPSLKGTATGTTQLRISLVDGTAFIDGDGTIPVSTYVGHTLKIRDSSGYEIVGVIKAVGSGETLGGELISNGTFDSDTVWSHYSKFEISGGTAHMTLGGTVDLHQGSTLDDGRLLKASIDAIITGTSTIRVGLGNWQLPTPKGLTISSSGTYEWYRSLKTYSTYNWYNITGYNATGGTLTVDNFSAKQVLTPSATGATIVSATGGTTYNWTSKHASFDPNSATFTWEIVPVSQGTITSSNVKLATVDGGAMVEITGVDLSPYAGNDTGGPVTIINPKSTSAATMTTNKYLLALYDSSGRVATGYVGAAGGGETLGAEIATGTLTAGKLYKITATEANHFYTGCAIGEYFTSVGTETCDASNKVQEVTEVEATGVHGHSTANATDRKMKLTTSGFNPNAVTSYKIYRTY